MVAQDAVKPLQPENPSIALNPGPIPETSDSAQTVREECHAGLVLRVLHAISPVAAGCDSTDDRRLRASVLEQCMQ